MILSSALLYMNELCLCVDIQHVSDPWQRIGSVLYDI